MGDGSPDFATDLSEPVSGFHWPRVHGDAYLGCMSRILRSVVGLYVLFALIGRFVEAMGAVRCGCATTCWCHRPGLSAFRWVFPVGHTSATDH